MVLREDELIPFEPSPLRGERLLVLAPHPDDEVIGCGGLVALHARERRRIDVVVVTDGVAGRQPGDDPSIYAATRKDESSRGLAILGVGEPRFLGFSDRGLDQEADDLAVALREVLAETRPDLVLAPSPIEIHPDHRALARVLCETLSQDEQVLGDTARVAFFETSQPIRPNAIVDISEVAEAKLEAIRAHATQHESRDYERFARGLSEYRALTMPKKVAAAEAYRVFTVGEIRARSQSAVTTECGTTVPVEIAHEQLPVTVITRTRNRPALLREAIASIRAGSYPARIVVVNDGGTSVRDVVGGTDDLDLIENETSRGRAEALNAGARAARTEWVAFLDDDDLYEPEHLQVLASAAAEGRQRATYSDAISIFLVPDDRGGWTERDRLRLFAENFDADLLLIDNYIPLPTLLVRREDVLDIGGFDPDFDLFEDWDFLIRLSRRGEFRRVPRITCAIRHFEGSDSAILSSPEGSARFREAKLRLWDKHRDLLTPDAIANAWERRKARLMERHQQWIVERGRAAHLERDVDRLEREKGELIAQIGEIHESAAARVHEIGGRLAEAESLLAGASEAAEARRIRIEEMERAIDDHTRTLEALFSETDRLNELLDTIYRSKTWKLHVMLEKLRGH